MLGVGTCFIPSIAFLVQFSPSALRWGFWSVVVGALLSCGMTALLYGSLFSSDFGRISSKSSVGGFSGVNPITISYLASAVIVLGFYLYFDRRLIRNAFWKVWLPVVLILIGTVPLLLGASRGSVLAILFPVILMLGSRADSTKDYLSIVAVCFVLFAVGVGLYFNSSNLGSSLVSRVSLIGSDIEFGDSSMVRFQIYINAWKQFIDNPLIGGGLVVSPYGGYPHNLFLESFMATGVLGGICFTIYTLYCLIASLRLLRGRSDFGWVSVLFMHYLIYAQLSSSLVTNSFYWVSSAAVVSLAASTKENRNVVFGRQLFFTKK